MPPLLFPACLLPATRCWLAACLPLPPAWLFTHHSLPTTHCFCACCACACCRYGSDMTERKWLARFLYLETVAGVPGMVSGGWVGN